MEMHQAMMEEVIHLGTVEREELSWEDTNLLGAGLTALEDLFRLYRDVHIGSGTPSGAYEATSLMRPCDGLKRGLRSERVGRGVRSEPGGFAARARRAPPSPYQPLP